MASRVEDFSNLVRENGLNVSKLDTDIVVNVKTLHSIYQLEMTQDHRIFIKGGKIGAALPVTHLASMAKDSYKLDWILCGSQLLVQTQDQNMIMTSSIQDVEIESKVDHWSLFVKQGCPDNNRFT